MTKVFVGMSGGVDSSLAAALLVEHGYDVTGVYMKNWSVDLPGMKCPWAQDLADAKRVAVKLGIDFKVYNFESEYKQKVVDYMIDEYKKGRTPNPDIMCNQEVKFKLFLETALNDGADLIATGHYARVECQSLDGLSIIPSSLLHAGSNKGPGALFNSDSRVSDGTKDYPSDSCRMYLDKTEIHSAFAGSSRSAIVSSDTLEPKSEPTSGLDSNLERSSVASNDGRKGEHTKGVLKMAFDKNKDQTYFLYRITGEALCKTLFPIGGFTKPEVRKMAEERGLATARKKDSQGICFVGQIGIRDFLQQYVEQKSGEIIDKQSGKILGHHDGAIFFTLGQRHGMDVGGGLPYYVVGKDIDKNAVYVSSDLNDSNLWRKTVKLGDLHWINEAPGHGKYQIRVRHRATLVGATVTLGDENSAEIVLDNPERAITAGQSIAVYDSDICLGGGVVI